MAPCNFGRSFDNQLHGNAHASTASMQAICARRQLLYDRRCAQEHAMSVHFFVIAGNSVMSRFLWTMAMRCSECDATFLVDPVLWCECKTATGGHRVPLVNWLDMFERYPCHYWHPRCGPRQNVWTRAAHCSATFSATPSNLASEVSTQVRSSTGADVLNSTETHHGSTTIQAWRGCRIGAKSLALQFTNSSLDLDWVEVLGIVVK